MGIHIHIHDAILYKGFSISEKIENGRVVGFAVSNNGRDIFSAKTLEECKKFIQKMVFGKAKDAEFVWTESQWKKIVLKNFPGATFRPRPPYGISAISKTGETIGKYDTKRQKAEMLVKISGMS